MAEASTCPSVAGVWNYLAQSAIASPGHVSDFYGGGYGASGDDVAPPFHGSNCLADFMGTSQDSVGSANGSTWFVYWTGGEPIIPAPGAVVLAGIGASLVGWLRRRRGL